MKEIAKTILPFVPRSVRRLMTAIFEKWYAVIAEKAMNEDQVDIRIGERQIGGKKRLLFYHPSGLSFGGTEKFLQILAKFIDKSQFEVCFMYSAKPRKLTGLNLRLDGRLDYLKDQSVKLIPFDYDSLSEPYPYIIRGAKPTIFEVIRNERIDSVITAGSGYTEFPFNLLRAIPIFMINIFGSFNVQDNFAANICISNEVADKIRPVVDEEKISVMYIPSEGPIEGSAAAGQAIRQRLGIKPEEMVFGRIGRAADSIFDPIGIKAFKRLVAENPSVHYLIMSSPPIMEKIVEEEQIPNVHFLPSSSKEEDVWGFHQAIDCLAHFRFDGESCGLNIGESMLCGKPIITHRSGIWNAHLEYLDASFSRVADKDDDQQYYEFMKEFAELKQAGRFAELGRAAKEQGMKHFHISSSIKRFENLIISRV
jgi:glycosyltransferase involved in cell wall biosynthesis